MFIAYSENTMRNAKFAVAEPAPIVRTIQQIRAEKRREAEAARKREIEAWRKKLEEDKQRRIDELRASAAVDAYRCITVRGMPEVKVPAKEIIAKVAAMHNMTAAEILSNRRHRPVVEARHDAIKAVADARPDLSLPQIGRIFGKDHTSIIHALNRRGGRSGASS